MRKGVSGEGICPIKILTIYALYREVFFIYLFIYIQIYINLYIFIYK